MRHFWSEWWESNPRDQLGRLGFYHWTTLAYLVGSLKTALIWYHKEMDLSIAKSKKVFVFLKIFFVGCKSWSKAERLSCIAKKEVLLKTDMILCIRDRGSLCDGCSKRVLYVRGKSSEPRWRLFRLWGLLNINSFFWQKYNICEQIYYIIICIKIQIKFHTPMQMLTHAFPFLRTLEVLRFPVQPLL